MKSKREEAIMRIVRLHPGLRSFSVFRMAGLASMDPKCRSYIVYRLRRKGLLAPSAGGKNAGRLYPINWTPPVFASSASSGNGAASPGQSVVGSPTVNLKGFEGAL